MADSLHQDNQTETEASRFLEKMQALQEASLELSRTTTLEELYRQAIVLGRSRLGFDRLGILLYDEANNLMRGTFGTDEQGNLRDERDFCQTVEDQRLLHVLHSPDQSSYLPDIQLHDLGQLVGEGWHTLAVLRNGEKGIGWLAIDNLLTRAPFDQRQRDILVLYGVTLGQLITTKRLEEELHTLTERRTRQIRLTTQVSQAIAGAANLDDLYERIVTEVKEQFGYYHTQLLRYDPQTDAVKLIAGYGEIGRRMKAVGHAMPLGLGLIGTAAATGQTVLRANLVNDPNWRSNPMLPDTRGEIAVPIKLGEAILGVLDVQSDVAGALGADDQLLLEGLCGQIAVAIESTRLTSELQETTTFLDSVIDNVPNMLFVKDAEQLRFVRQNKAGLAMLGITLDEIVGKNDYDLFPPAEAAFFIGKDRQVLNSGSLLDIPEELLRTPTGIRYLHTRKTPILDKNGRPKYLLGVSEDITERKQTEDALRQERALLNSLLDSIPDLIFYKDVDGVYLGCNTAFATFAGRSVADIVGKTDFDMFPHDVAAFFREQDMEMMAQGQSRQNEEWVDYPDGRRVLLDTLKTPFYDSDKNLLGLIGISRDVTTAYHSQEEVLRLSYVVEQSLDGTAVADMDGVIQFANPAWAAMHGYEVAELIGQHLSIFHTPEQIAQEVEPANRRAIQSGQPQRAEIGHKTKYGSVFPTLMTIGLLKDNSGASIGLVASAQDITERKIAENALQLRNSALEAAADAVVITNPKGKILYVNNAFTHLTQYQRQEALGETLRLIKSGVHDEAFYQQMWAVLLSGQSWQGEIINRRKDGTLYPEDMTITPVKSATNEITHFIAIKRDAGKRKETENALRENEARFRTILENANEIIYTLTPDGVFQFVSPAWTALLGQPLEEVQDHPFMPFVHPEDVPACVAFLERIVTTGESQRGVEYRVRHVDGSWRWHASNGSAVKDEQGNVLYYVGLAQDVTEQKAAAAAMRENETRLSEATRAARLYYWELDIATQQFLFTPGYYELLGTTAEEEGGYTMLVADYARKFVPPTESAIVEKETIAALETTDPNYSREFDSYNITTDGRIIPIRVRFRVVKDKEGRTIKTIGANQDITDQVKAEQALRDAQQRAETILRSITVPMLISKVSGGQIAYANEYLAHAIRLPLESLIGNATPNFYVRNEDRTAVISQIQTQGGVQNYQLQFRRNDGELFWALLSAQLIDFEGEPAVITSLIDVTDRIAAEEKLAQQAADLQTVADVSTAVRANLQDQQELLQQVVDLTQERFHLYHAHIYLLDSSGKALVLSAGSGEIGRTMTAEGRRIPLAQEQSLVARAARTRQSVIINDVQAEPGFLPHALLPETRSEMAAPMLIGDQVIGVLDIQSAQPNDFTAEDASIHTTLAAQIAIAVENARLLEQSQRAFEELDALTRRLTRESWETYLQSFDAQTRGYTYHYGQPLNQMHDLDLTAASMAADPSANPSADPSADGLLTHLLTVHGEPIGSLTLYEDREEEELPALETAEMEAIIAAVAGQLSARIENIRLTDQTQAALLLTENLYDAGRRLNTAGENLQEAVAAVAEAAPISAVTRLILFLTEYDSSGVPSAVRHVANWHSGKGNPPPAAGTRYTREMLQNMDAFNTREGIAVNDVTTDERLSPLMRFMFQQMRTPSLAILPLWVGDRQLGSLFLETSEPYSFRQADLEPYQALSGQLAIAIDRQRLLYEAEQRAERERQIRTITDKIRRGTDRETILQVARQEIGQMLRAKTAVAQLGASANLLARLHQQVMAEDEATNTNEANS